MNTDKIVREIMICAYKGGLKGFYFTKFKDKINYEDYKKHLLI